MEDRITTAILRADRSAALDGRSLRHRLSGYGCTDLGVRRYVQVSPCRHAQAVAVLSVVVLSIFFGLLHELGASIIIARVLDGSSTIKRLLPEDVSYYLVHLRPTPVIFRFEGRTSRSRWPHRNIPRNTVGGVGWGRIIPLP